MFLIAQNEQKIIAFNKSVDFEEIGNYKEAVKEIENIYSKFSNDYLVNLRLGWLNYLDKKYDESIKYYKKAISISNNSIEAQLGITYPLSAKNNWDEIKNVYANILDTDPLNYTARLNLAQIYLKDGDNLNAKINLEKLIEQYPSDSAVNLYLGWTYYYLGNKNKANNLFATALIADPTSSSAKEGWNLTK
jgi:tetratricopeptide (TPR) repeat protein